MFGSVARPNDRQVHYNPGSERQVHSWARVLLQTTDESAASAWLKDLMWKVVCVNCQHKAVTISRSDPLEQGAVPPVSFSMLYIS